jgi:predicted nucleotidyltransferase
LGFRQSSEPDDPICRWMVDNVKVDVMPTDEDILGFSNKWYSHAIENSSVVELKKNLKIRMVTAPYFLATKIEAFYGRGKNDFLASHDMEDIITIIDGREEVIEEINSSAVGLRRYLSVQFQDFLANELFIESLAGHLLPDKASQARLPILFERIRKIADLTT